jgi:hypothetical protein
MVGHVLRSKQPSKRASENERGERMEEEDVQAAGTRAVFIFRGQAALGPCTRDPRFGGRQIRGGGGPWLAFGTCRR